MRRPAHSGARNEFEDATPPPPQPSSFDIEDMLTPPPLSAPGAIPGNPGSAPAFRAMPPAPYPSPTFESPVVLNQPQTMDFRGAITSLLPEKKSGPPMWLGTVLIVGSLIGGAALARQATRGHVTAVATAVAAAESRIDGDGELRKTAGFRVRSSVRS